LGANNREICAWHNCQYGNNFQVLELIPGTGLTLTGSQFSITNTTVSAGNYGDGDRVRTFTVNQQGQLTFQQMLLLLVNAANLSGTTLVSSVINSSLTTLGVLTSLSVSGNITSGKLILDQL